VSAAVLAAATDDLLAADHPGQRCNRHSDQADLGAEDDPCPPGVRIEVEPVKKPAGILGSLASRRHDRVDHGAVC
jgi:hypothetical protein